jgi:hypothetical protein
MIRSHLQVCQMFRPLLSAIVHSVQPRVPAWRGAIMSILSSQRKVAWEESVMGYRSFVVAGAFLLAGVSGCLADPPAQPGATAPDPE